RMKDAGWKVIAMPELSDEALDALKQRKSVLEERRKDLTAQLETAKANATAAREAVVAGQRDLAEGKIDAAALGKIRARSREQDTAVDDTASALTDKERELEEVSRSVKKEEHTRSTNRQTIDSQALRQEAEALIKELVRSFLVPRELARKLQALASQFRRDFP